MKELLFNSRKVLSRNRYPWVDYARGICIILVCYRHVFEGLADVGTGSNSFHGLKYLNIFFFSFRMPLFFMVSGMFLGFSLTRSGAGEYVKKRFHTIFYPLLIWGTIHITLQLIFANYVHADRVPMDYLNLIINPRRIEQFWYLNALFFVGVLYTLIKVFAGFKAIQQITLGAIFFLASAFIFANHIEVGFLFDVLFFYLFFAIGDAVAGIILNARNYRFFTSWITFAILLPVFFLIQNYFTHLNLDHADDYYVQYKMPALYVLAALVGGSFIINVSFLLEKYNVLRFLRVIGYHSLYIYVIHLMITACTRIVMTRLLHITNVPLIMVASMILGIGIPIIFYNIAVRKGAWWLFTLRKNRIASDFKASSLPLKVGIVTPRESITNEN